MKKSANVRDLIQNGYEFSETIHRRMWEDYLEYLNSLKMARILQRLKNRFTNIARFKPSVE